MQSDGNLFSANHLIKFQQQFKPLNQGLQSATKMRLQSVLHWWITKCCNSGLESMLGVGFQSVTKWITKCFRDYKVWQSGLHSASGILKCGWKFVIPLVHTLTYLKTANQRRKKMQISLMINISSTNVKVMKD